MFSHGELDHLSAEFSGVYAPIADRRRRKGKRVRRCSHQPDYVFVCGCLLQRSSSLFVAARRRRNRNEQDLDRVSHSRGYLCSTGIHRKIVRYPRITRILTAACCCEPSIFPPIAIFSIHTGHLYRDAIRKSVSRRKTKISFSKRDSK